MLYRNTHSREPASRLFFTTACRILLLLLLLPDSRPAHADALDVLVVPSGKTEIYQRFQHELVARLAATGQTGEGIRLRTAYLENGTLDRDDVPVDTGLLITIGTLAARAVSALDSPVPVLHTLIPESTYRSLAPAQTGCLQHSAVFIDQPLQRQALLASLLFPDVKRYGVLLGPTSGQRRAEAGSISLAPGLELVVQEVTREEHTVATTLKLFTESDLLLAVNDPLVLNRENAKWLLYTTYQKQVPVIGFSRAYVRAGAAAAVFSEPEQLARQAAELVGRAHSGTTVCLPGPEHPRYFSVALNLGVCRSLGCVASDEEALGRDILEQEQRR